LLINATAKGKPLSHFWRKCVGAGRANEALRANWRRQMTQAARECGFQYVRFHGLLHDDMCVYRVADGRETFNFQYIDELFDFLLDINVRPFVEFGFMPAALASGGETLFWWRANVTPPRDWDKWAGLIAALTAHWRDRYGLAEIRRWYFEVWNEPNLHGSFWTGTKSEYFKLYACTARAVKAVDSALRVGGPAVSNFVPDARFDGETEDAGVQATHNLADLDAAAWKPAWVADFLEFCARERLPVDFVSAHPYPTDFALDGHGKMRGKSRGADSTRKDLETLNGMVRQSAFPNAEIHLTEWSSSPSSRDNSHDYNSAAAFVVKANIESAELADSLSYWTFTDVFEELGAGSGAFHGGFGLLSFQGVPKPTYHAYRFLHMLGEVEIARGDGHIVTRSADSGKLSALFYNYDAKSAVPMTNSFEAAEAAGRGGAAAPVCVTIDGVARGARFTLEFVDETFGNAMETYKKLGRPRSPNRAQTELLLAAANNFNTQILQAAGGSLNLNFTLNRFAVALLKEI
jgi:xylan 1,4-beta-xylosidase